MKMPVIKMNKREGTFVERKRAVNVLARAFQALFYGVPVRASILPDNFQFLIWGRI